MCDVKHIRELGKQKGCEGVWTWRYDDAGKKHIITECVPKMSVTNVTAGELHTMAAPDIAFIFIYALKSQPQCMIVKKIFSGGVAIVPL
tara:strand:- start:242 stop:508 length:267 start_codon:yes stop_codon:yes gene_type:complete